MPYFVYRVRPGPGALIKQLTLLARFDKFAEAKRHARGLRASGEDEIKVTFADTELQAEEQLQEKREAPVLREWEK